LYEHAAGTAARVIHHALIRLDKFRDQLNHISRGIELTVLFGCRNGKRLQEVLINTHDQILFVVSFLAYLVDGVDEVLDGPELGAKGGEVIKG